MDWETSYDAERGRDWAPRQPAKKERPTHKDLVKWQNCFRDNCSAHRWEKVDAKYYLWIVGKDGVLSKRDMTHRKCRRTVRIQHEGEGDEKYLRMLNDWRRKSWSSGNNLTVPPKPWSGKNNKLLSSITIIEPYAEANAK